MRKGGFILNKQSLYISPPILDKRFPIYIEKQKHKNMDEIFRLHWHEHLELILMETGELSLTCNALKYHGKPGDLLIINPNDVHHLESETLNVEFYCIIFNLSMVRSLMADPTDMDFLIPLSNNKIVFDHLNSSNSELKQNIIKLSQIYNDNHQTKGLDIKAHIFQILSLLFRKCNHSTLTPLNFKKRNCNLTLIQNLLEYLHNNYSKKIDIKQLSTEFNISYHHLCHIFKEFTNQSIIQYVTSLRIDKALFYLLNTDKTITEIALLIGYNDMNYFSRKFKQIMSMSPRQYINSLKPNETTTQLQIL